ncbi:MAG TPA: threonine synthase [Alphaproteobacteria bacterium]|nr:threonine synthase [Alphaproteobacteria bacterium]
MRYISTRGTAPALGFDDALLAGLARDGGLYVPESWPAIARDEIAGFKSTPYAEVALRAMRPFVAGSALETDFPALVRDAYAAFDDPAVAPLRKIGPEAYLLELFHGPTLAFKDMALQLVGRLFDRVLAARGARVTVVGATSGDTGSAAIAACRDRAAIDIFILHPEGRVSEVQRRQMTTVMAPNVWNVAIQGSFDDCQDLVKGMFNDAPFRDALGLSAVNSINWARIMAQIPYYFSAAAALGAPAREIAFAVPTGNFGNVYAGYAARAMGLPISQLIVGSNRNDILTRFFDSGDMSMRAVEPTLSPSMDIQVSSNFERLLFDLLGRDGARVRQAMERFRAERKLPLGRAEWQAAARLFAGYRVDDEATKATIASLARETGIVIDPHSAVGLAAGRARRRDPKVPLVALATAHPAKFPDAVEAATGKRPEAPERLARLMDMPERLDVLPNDLAAVEGYLRARARAAAGPR